MSFTGTTPYERADNISADSGQFFSVSHKKASFQLLAGSNKTQINLSLVGDSGLTLDLTLKGVFQIAEGAITLADVLGKITQFTLSNAGVTVIQETYGQGYDLAFFDTPNNWVYGLTLLAGDDSFTGSSAFTEVDSFQGMSGNDTMTGNKGNDFFDGGTGLDTLVFSGNASEYTIDWKNWVANPILEGVTQLGIKVTDASANRDGIDQAIGVEYLKFSDTTLAVAEHTASVGINKLYLGPNGHWYGVVAQNSISIEQALLDAQGRSLNGSPGYVATIGSAIENAFIKTVLASEAANYNGILMLGASDRVTEDDWRWLGGPEKNTSTTYFNWDPASGEPNHVYGGIKEDYLAINGNGLWVDVPSGNYSNVGGYVIEFSSDSLARDPNEWVRFVGAAGDDRVYAINRSSDGVLWGSGTTSGSVGANISLGQEDYILVKLDAGGNPLLTQQNGSLHGGVDESFASAIDASGNVYVTGYGGQFPNLVHEGVIDAYIAKYTSAGQLSWIKSFGGVWADTGRAIAIGGNGNIYVTGSSDDSYTGYDSPLDPNSFLAIYSPQGEKIKYQPLGFSSGDSGYAIDVANDGSVYIGGALSGTVAQLSAQGVDGYLAKYTSSGEQVWLRLIGEQHREEIHALTVDESGAIYVAGVTEGSLGGDNLGGYDGFIAKYLPSGERLWVSHFGSSGHDYVASMAIGSDGLIYVAGNADGAFAKQTPLGNGDAYVLAFNASGQQVGTKVFGSSEGDSASSIVRGPDGYLLVSGATWGSFGGNQNQGIIDGYVSQMKEFGTRSVASPFAQKLTIDPAGVIRSPKFYYDSETIDTYPVSWSDWYTYHPGDSSMETKTNTKLVFVSDWSAYTAPPYTASHFPVFPVGPNVLVRNVFEFTGDFSSSNNADWQLANGKQVAEWKDGANGTVTRYTLSDREGDISFVSFLELTNGWAGADAVVGSFGADAISVHQGADSVQGRGGNDTLTGGEGNDTLDGGMGQDVAAYAMAASNYVVASVLDGYTVTAQSGSEGVDFLSNIETLRFKGQDQKVTNLVSLTEMFRPNQMASITSDGVIKAAEILQVMSDRLKFEGSRHNLDFSSVQLSPYAALAWSEASVASNASEFDVQLSGASGEILQAKLKVTETTELIQVTLRTATDTLVFDFDDAQSHTTLLKNGKLNNFENSKKSVSLASTLNSGSKDLSYALEGNWVYQKNLVAGSYTWTQGPNTVNSAYSHGGYTYSFRDKDSSSGSSSSTSYADDKTLTDAFTVQYRFDDANTGFGLGFDLAKVAAVADAIDFKNSVYETNSIKVEAASVHLDAQSSSSIDPNYDLTKFIAGSTEGTSLSDVEYAATQLFLPLLLQAGNFFAVKGSTGALVQAGLGNDTVTGGAGDDTIDGGAGTDTAVYDGRSTDFEVERLSDGSWSVKDTRAVPEEDTDTLIRMELLQFNDGTVRLFDGTFSPADEATAVAIGANVVVTFSENVQRGAGSIVLKKGDGTTVATYAQSSTEVAVSGNTLTLNPALDLAYSTDYKVEFAAGSVRDLAGNNYAGTTTYNFRTADPAVSVSVAPDAVSESGTANLVYTFSREGDTSKALTINIGLSGTADGDDYLTLPPLASATRPAHVWTKTLGTSANDYARGLATGADGSIYVTGYTGGSLDAQVSQGGDDAFLAKYGVDGTKLWTRLLGTSGNEYANAVATGQDGSIYVTGTTTGLLDGQSSRGEYETFLTKYSADGTKVWTRLIGAEGWDKAYGLTVGLDGSIYIAGDAQGSFDGLSRLGMQSGFLVKYSAEGVKTWVRLNGATQGESSVAALTTGLDGSVYMSGWIKNGALEGNTYSGALNYDAFLVKYDSSGQKLWAKQVPMYSTPNSKGSLFFDALATGLDGSIYVGAKGGAFAEGSSTQVTDYYIYKYGAGGELVWSRAVGLSGNNYLNNDVNYGVTLTLGADGSIYISGHTKDSLTGETNKGQSDAFVAKFHTDGTKVWTKLVGSSGEDVALDLSTGLDGSIYASGWTTGSFEGRANSGGRDAFIAKLSVDAPTVTFAAGSSTATLTVDPTPDSLVEGNETVSVAVKPGTGYSVGTAAVAVGTITEPQVDTTAPTALTFSPADEATAVVIGANVVVTFSENIQRGAGSIVLKKADGTTVATYAQSSTEVTVSGSTLIINPVSDLSYSTGYTVEFATGSVQDLAGNNYAGTTTYNFTTAASQSGGGQTNLAAKFWKDASKAPTETDKSGAVNLTDAISILKMIVGLSVNSNNAPLSPYQAVAADFDQSGSVDLGDAIGVLKMVVGLAAPMPTWRYFDDAKLASSYNVAQPLNHKAWSAGAAVDGSLAADSTVKLVGVLTGDVDGSWAG